jgi:hypothetical protein
MNICGDGCRTLLDIKAIPLKNRKGKLLSKNHGS